MKLRSACIRASEGKFGGVDVRTTLPALGTTQYALLLLSGVPCSPCYRGPCPTRHRRHRPPRGPGCVLGVSSLLPLVPGALDSLVGLTRFELVTPRLSSVCSNQLSYRPSTLLRIRSKNQVAGSLKTRQARNTQNPESQIDL